MAEIVEGQTEEDQEALLGAFLSSLRSSSSAAASSSSSSSLRRLHRLIDLSRHHSNRTSLASLRAVPRLLSALPHLLLPCTSPNNLSISIHSLTLLSLVLKLLRNLCAGEALNQHAFLQSGGVESVASVFRLPFDVSAPNNSATGLSAVHLLEPLETFQQDTKELDSPWLDDLSEIRPCIVSVFQMALQLLGNVCGGGEPQKEAVWQTYFPTMWRRLALTKEEKILEPLCMVMYTCSSGNRTRLTDLCHGDGAALVSACLIPAQLNGNSAQQMPSTDEPSAPYVSIKVMNDWLYLLVSQLCLRESLFPLLFKNLVDSRGVGLPVSDGYAPGVEPVFCAEQAVLLDILCFLLSEKEKTWSRGLSFEMQEDSILPMPSGSIGFLAAIIRTASSCSDSGCPYLKRPCGISSIDVLSFSLEIVKTFSAWECDKKKVIESPTSPDIKEGESTRSAILTELVSHGLIRLCLELLHDLGPPELISRAMKTGSCVDLAAAGYRIDSSNERQISEMCVLPTLETREAKEPCRAKCNLAGLEEVKAARLPYQGYRRDLVAVIGNAAYQSRSVQDEVGKLGGLTLILQQCVVDAENPFLREWGLWAIRNLVEGNEGNTREISEMQLKGSFTPVELTQIGMKVVMDPLLGRPKLVNVPP